MRRPLKPEARVVFISGAFLALLVVASLVHPPAKPPQSETAQQSNADASNGSSAIAEAEERIALYNYWLMLFTGVLGAVAVVQGVLLYRQDRIANRQFVATFRPKLTVRAMRLDSGVDEQQMPIGVVTYHLANTGSTRARIVGGSIGSGLFVKNTPFPALPDLKMEYNTPFELGPEITIEGGSSIFLTHQGGTVHDPRAADSWLKHSDIIVVGLIIYADENDVRRTLAFLRRYDPASHRFAVVLDPDYEYAD
jgi:hypothetical protein